jgi:uncharacterized protein (TIGR00645 family)
MNTPHKNFALVLLEGVIFNIKWVLPLFYLGLTIILMCYAVTFAKEIGEVIMHFASKSTDDMKLIVLDFIDIVMVANLVKMIIAGSYHSFISKDHGRKDETISSGTLKIKIATSIVIVGSIHLLRMLVSPIPVLPDEVYKVAVIYSLFLITAVVLSGTEYVHHLAEHGMKKEDSRG